MSTIPNILLEVAALSMRLSAKYLQPHSSKYCPQKFTQSQLLSCLILRAYLKTTYRGVIEFLEAPSELRKVLQLKRLPHYSTLKYFADRSNVDEISNLLMAEIIRQFEAPTIRPPRGRSAASSRPPSPLSTATVPSACSSAGWAPSPLVAGPDYRYSLNSIQRSLF